MRLLGVGNLSSQPQKRAVIFPYWEETDPLVGAVPGIILSAHTGVRIAMFNWS